MCPPLFKLFLYPPGKLNQTQEAQGAQLKKIPKHLCAAQNSLYFFLCQCPITSALEADGGGHFRNQQRRTSFLSAMVCFEVSLPIWKLQKLAGVFMLAWRLPRRRSPPFLVRIVPGSPFQLTPAFQTQLFISSVLLSSVTKPN